MFGNLKQGSHNHLRGFVWALAQAGETYSPGLLTAEQHNDIANGQMERSKGQGRGRQGQRRGRQTISKLKRHGGQRQIGIG